MIETLEKYGFKFRLICDCAGPRTYKYKVGDYTVYWNKKKKAFRLKHHTKYLTPLTNEEQFEGEIKKYLTEVNVQAVPSR